MQDLHQGHCKSALYRVLTHGRIAGKFVWYTFFVYLTLNVMVFYGIMIVYVTPDLIVGTILSALFYLLW